MTPDSKDRVPVPPHPRDRREPLPGQNPRSAEEDQNALNAIQIIRQNPSYCLAEQDPNLLTRDDMRGPRLEIEYLKPDIILAEHKIDRTIVVFGSTRIPEPETARCNMEHLRKALAADPGNANVARRLAAAEKIFAKCHYYTIAREFGHLVGRAGDEPCRAQTVTIMTGGGPGLMEAANRGASDAGAKSVGLNIDLPHEQYPNPYITPGLCFRFHYFALRKMHLLLRAKALVAFPGGYGTFDELFEVLTLIQTRKIKPMPIVLVGETYWRRAIDLDFLVDEGTIDPEDRELFWFAETAREIWDGILRWYEMAGEPLFSAG